MIGIGHDVVHHRDTKEVEVNLPEEGNDGLLCSHRLTEIFV